MPACRYVEENGSASMLAAKRSAPEVNLGEFEHVCFHQPSIRLVLKPRGDVTISPEQGYQ